MTDSLVQATHCTQRTYGGV